MNNIFCITDFETTGTDPLKDYPIEIGCIFTNHKFEILDVYTELLKPEDITLWFDVNTLNWRKEFIGAYNIHKITPAEIINKGITFKEGVFRLVQKINNVRSMINNNKVKPIIISDCAYFEMAFMNKLFKLAGEENFPFHYCAYDTNLSLCVFSNIGDPKTTHRALNDASVLYIQLLKYIDEERKFRGENFLR
jgi:DNA polymerase III epsilon subunit-like protein